MEKFKPSRRELLVGATVGSLLVGAGIVARELSKGERVEGLENKKQFDRELSGYLSLVALDHDQVLFVDEDNVPVGAPVEFKDIIASKAGANGEVIQRYRYSAGVVGEDGILLDVPTLEWREKMKEKVEEQYPERTVADSYNIIRLFRASIKYDDEPELQAGILDGSIRSYADLVDYFAEKSVIGDEDGRSRYEYVHKAVEFNSAVPAIVQSELRELIPGICAQESKFNNGLKSKSGAIGIFQFMPWVWEKYGKSEEDIKSLKIQVEVAGELFSDIYGEFMYHTDEEALIKARGHFTDPESFLIDFVVPMLANSYNAGSARMGEVVDAYFKDIEVDSSLKGKDLFRAVVDFGKNGNEGRLAEYSEHSREYVPRVYAHAIAIHGRQK